jgi:hypothetical protein
MLVEQHGRNLPDDPLRFIQQCVRARRIYWTYHVNLRLRERSIPRRWILDSVETFEIIETYPEDKYLPSYLVWAEAGDAIIHVLFAIDMEEYNIRVITAHRPAPAEWSADKKRRIGR